jgi:hypothetical protein
MNSTRIRRMLRCWTGRRRSAKQAPAGEAAPESPTVTEETGVHPLVTEPTAPLPDAPENGAPRDGTDAA